MSAFIVPMICVILTAMATLTCLRFVLSREGIYWVIPCIISILLTLDNIDTLILLLDGNTSLSGRTLRNITPVLLAFLWYMMIITFHYALRFKIKVNRYRNDNRKNLKEAEFMEKMERRKRKKEDKLIYRNIDNKAEDVQLYEKESSDKWVNLFDD